MTGSRGGGASRSGATPLTFLGGPTPLTFSSPPSRRVASFASRRSFRTRPRASLKGVVAAAVLCSCGPSYSYSSSTLAASYWTVCTSSRRPPRGQRRVPVPEPVAGGGGSSPLSERPAPAADPLLLYCLSSSSGSPRSPAVMVTEAASRQLLPLRPPLLPLPRWGVGFCPSAWLRSWLWRQVGAYRCRTGSRWSTHSVTRWTRRRASRCCCRRSPHTSVSERWGPLSLFLPEGFSNERPGAVTHGLSVLARM